MKNKTGRIKRDLNKTGGNPFILKKINIFALLHIQADMMTKESKFLYTETEDVQVLGLPYVSDNLAMFILLPKERFGLEKMEKSLDGASLQQLISQTRTTKVLVIS